MSQGKAQKSADKKMSDADIKKAIAAKEKEIIRECKLLATFKVSSAVHINEKTKELLKLEGKA